EIQRARLELSEAQSAIERTSSDRTVIEERIGEWQSAIQGSETVLSQLTNFLLTVADWRRTLASQRELSVLIVTKDEEVSSAKRALEENTTDLEAALAAERSANEVVARLQQVQSELQTLLDNIIAHTTSEVCPVCGTAHESPDELLEKISHQRGVQPQALTSALSALDSARTQADRCREAVERHRQAVARLSRELVNVKRQLDESKARLKEHIATAMALPISSEVTPDSYEVVANSKVAELSDLLTKNRESLAAQLSEADKQLERTQNAAERRKTASARL